jgi:hypothetical protein
MSRVSVRTLILMLELLAAVAAVQYLTRARSVAPDAVWLATDGIAQPSAPAGEIEDPSGMGPRFGFPAFA